MIHIAHDNFVWLDLTRKCKSTRQTEELFSAHELYEVCDDETCHLIEDINSIPLLIKQGARICLEVGNLPFEYIPKEVWKDTDKIQKDGYWYVKIADIN